MKNTLIAIAVLVIVAGLVIVSPVLAAAWTIFSKVVMMLLIAFTAGTIFGFSMARKRTHG